MKIGKYAFNSLEKVEDKTRGLGTSIDEDGNVYPSHNHTIFKLGHIALNNAEEDEDTILSDEYHIDVLWQDLEADEDGDIKHPYGWATYAADVEGEGVHGFLGLDYQKLKIINN